jgi:protoporphyrinogen oxidase
MSKIAVIGSGISGLSISQMLKAKGHEIIIFEKAPTYGGLVKCTREHDSLFHRVGGHVFNSRNQAVLDWFWGFFDRDKEFLKATRNAKILLGDKVIGYPIENYLYQVPADIVSKVLDDMLSLQGNNKKPEDYPHFEAFLKGNFGETLYNLYFGPYNHKIWNLDLSTVPLAWLDGKLPMPNLKQMLMSNIIREEEREMVHATFFYAKENGSQFIVDRLAEGLEIRCSTPVTSMNYEANTWIINGTEQFDGVVFTGDVRMLGTIYSNASQELKTSLQAVQNLRSNGTSNLFCESDDTDVSWLYLPEAKFKAHRIIYTGNFSESNNRGSKRTTCVVEFSGTHTYEEMCAEIKHLPGNLSPIAFNQEANSYIIQDLDTRTHIATIKNDLGTKNFHLLGRFGEWEYYNMDKAVEAAMDIAQMW